MRLKYLSRMNFQSQKILSLILVVSLSFIVGCEPKAEKKEEAYRTEKPIVQEAPAPAPLPVTQAQRYLSYQPNCRSLGLFQETQRKSR